MADHTPTTAFVRRHYAMGPTAYYEDGSVARMPTAADVAYAEEHFDRWLASVRAETLREAAELHTGVELARAACDAYPHRNVYLEGGAYMAEERSRIPLRKAFEAGARWVAAYQSGDTSQANGGTT